MQPLILGEERVPRGHYTATLPRGLHLARVCYELILMATHQHVTPRFITQAQAFLNPFPHLLDSAPNLYGAPSLPCPEVKGKRAIMRCLISRRFFFNLK